MIVFARSRFAVCIGAAVALLAGCGSQPAGVVPGVTTPTLKPHRTFYFTGSAQFFKVPIGVKWITVDARGAAGERKSRGRGGRVTAEVPVVEGERLGIFVGGAAKRVTGGYNGGGSGGYGGDGKSFGGGGATDVREGGDHLQDRIIVAGGGGGQGEYRVLAGDGGGRTADPGYPGGGKGSYGGGGGGGGSQIHGGSGGSAGGTASYAFGKPGAKGSLGTGGSGGAGAMGNYCPAGAAGYGGGGGGGYYGGGGGGGGGCTYSGWTDGGGGGGGSSYIEPRARNSQSWKGWTNNTRNGLVILSW